MATTSSGTRHRIISRWSWTSRPIELLRVPADHGWFSTTIVAPAEDQRFRVLSDQDRLLTFLQRLDLTADWADPQVAEPVGGILPMFTIVDQRKRFLRGDMPCAHGLVGLGDSIAATNPSLASGTSFALMPQDVIAQPGLLERVGATIERVGPLGSQNCPSESSSPPEPGHSVAETLGSEGLEPCPNEFVGLGAR